VAPCEDTEMDCILLASSTESPRRRWISTPQKFVSILVDVVTCLLDAVSAVPDYPQPARVVGQVREPAPPV
jgi:hypothetical protein